MEPGQQATNSESEGGLGDPEGTLHDPGAKDLELIRQPGKRGLQQGLE